MGATPELTTVAPAPATPWRLEVGDCRIVLPQLDLRAAALITDPPAGLGFMGLAWDLARGETFAEFLRQCFAAALPKLLPGAWVLVWAHPQTSHWTAIALERAGYEIEAKIPWINAEAKPQPWRVGRLAPGHEEWILARAPGLRRPLDLRMWRDATGGRHPRSLVIGRAAADVLDAVVGRRRSGAMSGTRKADKSRNSYGTNKASTVTTIAASDGGPSRFFPSEAQLLALYGPRARHRKHRLLGPGDGGRESEHPTPKSVELLLPLVDLVCGEEPGCVLDIFAGSAAVGEAALLLGHSYVGIELGDDPRWPIEARERLTRTVEFLTCVPAGTT